MRLHPGEFENYRIGVDADVTFCLKEARVCIIPLPYKFFRIYKECCHESFLAGSILAQDLPLSNVTQLLES